MNASRRVRRAHTHTHTQRKYIWSHVVFVDGGGKDGSSGGGDGGGGSGVWVCARAREFMKY